MLTVSPDCATQPAMPSPVLSRMGAMAPPCATFETQLVAVVGDEEDGRALGVEQLGHLLEQHDQQAIEIERGAEHAAELADRLELALLDAQPAAAMVRPSIGSCAHAARSRTAARYAAHSRPRARRASSSSPRRWPSSWSSVVRTCATSSSREATARARFLR